MMASKLKILSYKDIKDVSDVIKGYTNLSVATIYYRVRSKEYILSNESDDLLLCYEALKEAGFDVEYFEEEETDSSFPSEEEYLATELDESFINQLAVAVDNSKQLNLDDFRLKPNKLLTFLAERKKELEKISAQYQKSSQDAEAAKSFVKELKHEKIRFGKTKQAVIDTQEGLYKTAEAVEGISKTQDYLQKYQEYLTTFTEQLFCLGASSIAANRSVVRELEILLRGDETGGKKEQLDNLAKQELYTLFQQLNAQADILEKQEKQKEVIIKNKNDIQKLFENEKKIQNLVDENKAVNDKQDLLLSEQAKKDAEHDKLLAEQAEKDAEHDKLITEQAERDAEHDRLIAEQAEKDAEHDRLIAEQAEKDVEHDRLIAEQAEKDSEHDKLIAEQAKKDAEHDRLIADQAEKDSEHDKLIAEQAEKDAEHDRLIAEQEKELKTVKNELEQIKKIYKEKKKNNTILIIVLFALVLALLVLSVLFGMNIISFNKATFLIQIALKSAYIITN